MLPVFAKKLPGRNPQASASNRQTQPHLLILDDSGSGCKELNPSMGNKGGGGGESGDLVKVTYSRIVFLLLQRREEK